MTEESGVQLCCHVEEDTVVDLQCLLIRNGFVRCDIPACNCGSWHARHGLPERLADIQAVVNDAGYPLDDVNGHQLLLAIHDLVHELNTLRLLAAMK